MRGAWVEQSQEDRALFNPAFIALLIARFVAAYQKTDGTAAPMSLTYLATTMVLHRPTRDILPSRTSANYVAWIAQNDHIRIALPDAAKKVAPVVGEGLLFALVNGVCVLTPPVMIGVGGKAPKTRISGRTQEVISCQRAAEFLGRWFARAGNEATILALMGVTP